MNRSETLDILQKHLPKKEHTILIGARQVGKTTLVKKLQETLQLQKENVYFLTLEDPALLKAVDDHPENIFKYTLLPSELESDKKLYIIIDEVQYAADPTNLLKLLYDKYAGKVKIVATGSSAFYIDRNFRDSLAGRKKIVELYPLDFDEFLHFKGEEKLAEERAIMQRRSSYIGTEQYRLNNLLEEYFIYGGYPAVVLASTEEDKKDLLKELVTSYMKKDALEAGIKEELKFFQLAKLLADQAGGLVNHHELANTLQMASGTIDNYIYLLQKSFIVHLLPPFFGNVRKELTKMPKVFFNDNGLRNALLNNYNKLSDRNDKGALLENYVFTRLRSLYSNDALRYWRTADGNEVDFIVQQEADKGIAYEVKYSDSSYKSGKYKKFMEGYPNYLLSVISKEMIDGKGMNVIRL